MDYRAKLLRPGEETRFNRETSNVFDGRDGQRGLQPGRRTSLRMVKNDVIVMPNFLWRPATSIREALMRNIGQYRLQCKERDGTVAQNVA